MQISKIKGKIEENANVLCESSNIEDMDESILALLSLLTRFIAESEQLEKGYYHWNVLHTYLHFSSTNNSKKSVIKSIIFYLSMSNQDFKSTLKQLGSYIKEYKDDYWTWKEPNTFISEGEFHVVSSRVENPVEGIWGVKAHIKNAKNTVFLYSFMHLKSFHVYRGKIKNFSNNLNHKRYFLINPQDISKFKKPINPNIINGKYINAYYSKYPENHKSFCDINKLNENKFFYINKDKLLSSTPSRDIDFKDKVSFLTPENEKIEMRKWKLQKELNKSNLPFTKLFKRISTDSRQTPYSLVELNEFTTNYKTYKVFANLIEIFDTCSSSQEKLFLESHENKTLTIRPAGSGKSTKVKNFINSNPNYKFYIFTPTKKANEVFLDISHLDNVEIYTIQKFAANDGKIFPYGWEKDAILFFDEISMYEFDWWNKIARLKLYKQINFMGDPWQISPINQKSISHLLGIIAHNKIVAHNTLMNNNFRLDKGFENYNKNSLLLQHTRNGKINMNNSTYKDFFISYDGYKEAFEIIKKREYANYTFITALNNGVLSVNNINRILNSFNFKIGDEVIWNSKIQDDFYPGLMLKIKNITPINDTICYEFEGITNSVTTVENENAPFNYTKTLSAHRSQGQTIENVFVIITETSIIDIKWFYTAISRARKNIKILHPLGFNFSNMRNNDALTKEEEQDMEEFIKEIKNKPILDI